MTNMRRFPGPDDLFQRDTIEIELPRVLIRIFEKEVAKASADASEEESLTLNHYLEYHLAEFVSRSDVAELELEVPGIAKAVWRWLEERDLLKGV
jgi:hypothetical protein